jgi:hypothetical protein
MTETISVLSQSLQTSVGTETSNKTLQLPSTFFPRHHNHSTIHNQGSSKGVIQQDFTACSLGTWGTEMYRNKMNCAKR